MFTTATFPTTLLASVILMANGVWAGMLEKDAPRSNVSIASAYTDAVAVASQSTSRQVVRMDGDSMFPYFGPGTIAVVEEIRYEQIKAGMVLVYRNADNLLVAHRAIARVADGWTVKGFNNQKADSATVTPENLAGVLYATFNTAGRSSRTTEVASVSSLPVVWGLRTK